MSWWQEVITQAFGQNGERGVDLGTPYGTPITSLEAGTVSQASCGHPWGCELGIDTTLPGVGPVIEYFLHLDRLDVGLGQQIQAGQDVGISGGQLQGGNYPNSPTVSSGPHLEVGFFRGQFWGPSFDPLAIVRQGPGAGGPSAGDIAGGAASLIPGLNKILSPTTSNALQDLPTGTGLAAIGQAINNLPANIGHGLADFGTALVHNSDVFLQRQLVALAVAAVVLLVLFLG